MSAEDFIQILATDDHIGKSVLFTKIKDTSGKYLSFPETKSGTLESSEWTSFFYGFFEVSYKDDSNNICIGSVAYSDLEITN
jgi:hypothetical protein